MKLGPEPADHAIGCSRGGLTTKLHMVTDGKGRMLSVCGPSNGSLCITAGPVTLDSRSHVKPPRQDIIHARGAWASVQRSGVSRSAHVCGKSLAIL